MSIVPGKLLGSYRMLDVVGEGSFGQVWKARKVGALQTVAIKLIPKSGKKDRDIQGLRQEIDILKTLRHNNIIQMLDAFETPSDFCVVTEFAQGELFEILETDTSLSEEVVQTIAKQLVAALHYLHSNRIIHRDMKPQNILISADGTVKLCDFGFARAMSQDTFVLTSIKGTPLYMAPELVQEQPYTPAVDVWSMGVILYELFVGKPPFYTTSIYKLIKQIVNDSPPYPSAMSKSFRDFLQGVLEKDPKKRLGWPELLAHPFISDDGCPPGDPPRDSSVGRSRSPGSTRTTTMPTLEPSSAATTPFASSTRQPAVPRANPNAARSTPITVANHKSSNKIQEPVFVDPPQFSPQGSPSPADGPMGSAIAERLPSGNLPQNPPILALLVDAERRVQRGIEDPSSIVTDPATLEAIRSALAIPSSGRALVAWCKLQETQYAVTLIDKILSKIPEGVSLNEVEPSGQLVSVLVLLAKTGHVCVGTNAQFSATVAAALRKCSDWVVCLETVSLCSELVSSRGSWPVTMEGCEGIRAWAVRSQCALLSPDSIAPCWNSGARSAHGTSPAPSSSNAVVPLDPNGAAKTSRGMARKLLDRLVVKKVPGRICRCIEDYNSSNDGQIGADDKLVMSALRALASMLPCAHDTVSGCSCRGSIYCDGLASLDPSDASVMGALWDLTARYVFESKVVLNCLIRSLAVSSTFTTMAIRIMRLDPRFGRPLLVSRILDAAVVDDGQREVGALLGKGIFDSVALTCTDSDISFLEQQCGPRLASSVKRGWVAVLSSSSGQSLGARAAVCGALASYTLLFHKHWSPSALYAYVNMLKGRTDDIKAMLGGDNDTYVPGMGCAEGFPSSTCFRDGPSHLTHALAIVDHKLATASGLVDAAFEAILRYHVRSDGPDRLSLSPAGIASCLQTVRIGVENDTGALEKMIDREGLSAALIAFLSQEFADRNSEFYGPSDKRATSILDASRGAALAILQAPWVHAPMLCNNHDATTKAFKARLARAYVDPSAGRQADNNDSEYMKLIQYVVNILRESKPCDANGMIPGAAVPTDRGSSSMDSVMPSCAAMMARLALVFGDEAVVMFARSGGVDNIVLGNMLRDSNPDAMLGSSLLVVSQLARTATSKSQVERFIQANIMPLIPPLLRHPSSSGVRARACNLLGNLCRHSQDAYPSIRELRILPPLIHLCDDEDQSTRKFACFAIGNAGFHSDYLYSDLRPAVCPLVQLLEDEEDRTVANAAGALGNLVRNSSELVPEMLACKAVEALLHIVERHDSASTAFQIALFSLGNLAAHQESRLTLEELGVAKLMEDIQRNPSMSRPAVKYASRLLNKMAGTDGRGDGSKTQQVQQTPYVSSKSKSKVQLMNE